MRRRELSRRAQAFGFVVAMTFALGVQLPLAAFAQDGIDPVTRFARDPVHVAVWPGGRKVAVSFALFVEEFGFGRGPVFRPDLATRKPDLVHECDTLADQAFIYALSGDRNPLHRDPAIAKMAGFPRPILHGLCTYGITCRAVLQTYADYDSAAFKSHAARFSSPVFPGETITVDLWKDGPVISFEARIQSRNVTCIKNGKTVLG